MGGACWCPYNDRISSLVANAEISIQNNKISVYTVPQGSNPVGYQPAGVLINTSFNTRGQPMVNRAEDAVCLLCQLHGDGLDHVWIDGWLFSQDRGQACRACSAEGMARISESVMWP